METEKISLSAAADMLRSNDNILILMHAKPDGDTVGSAIALETALRSLGKRAYAVCDDNLPERLMFILEFRREYAGGEGEGPAGNSSGISDDPDSEGAEKESDCENYNSNRGISAMSDGVKFTNGYAAESICPDSEAGGIERPGPDCIPGADAKSCEVSACADILKPERLPADFTPGLTVTVDAASEELLGGIGAALEGKIDLKLDHHPMGTDFARYSLIYPGASACGELIFDLVSELGAMSRQAACAIYAAISSDSGSFRFDSVTAKTHERAAALLRMGIPHGRITEALYNTKSLSELAAEALAIDNLRMYCGGRIALTCLTLGEMERRCFTGDDAGFINGLPMCIRGVVISLVLKQQDKDSWKLSVRTGEGFAANEICALLGGGGHVRAAGCRLMAETTEAAIGTALDAVSRATGLEITRDQGR